MQIKEKLGISIGQIVTGRPKVFVQNGIRYMEFRIDYPEDETKTHNLINAVLHEKDISGINILSCHLPFKSGYDMSDADERKRRIAVEMQKRFVTWLLPLNPDKVVVHPSQGTIADEDREQRISQIVKSLKEFAPFCKEHGLKIALENLIQGSIAETSHDLLKIIKEVGCDNVGICFDVNHLFYEKHSDFIRNTKDYLLTMHVSDNDGIKECHIMPGNGVINWKEIFSELEKINYDSTMITECAYILRNFPESVPEYAKRWVELHK